MSKQPKPASSPGENPIPPLPGSRGFLRVLSRGCGGVMHDTPWGRDFDCDHGYTWNCDDCPLVRQQQIETEAAYNAETSVRHPCYWDEQSRWSHTWTLDFKNEV